jgi:hypothetical protein
MEKLRAEGEKGSGRFQGLSGELELQARWFSGEFGRDFVGTDGEAVRVVQFGIWNRVAGPDFVDAAVSIDGREPQRGSIEIDADARDWERHGHATNPEYEGVRLHVFLHSAPQRFFSRTRGHRRVPQVRLSVPGCGSAAGEEAVANPGRCARALQGLSLPDLREVLHQAGRYRFERKAADITRTAEVHGGGEALFQAVAAGMGYPGNQLPFRLVAQRLPLRRLQREAEAVEALLFGVGGFLPGPDLSTLMPEARLHARALWEKWWRHWGSHQTLSVPRAVWRLGGQRPANHPQRRLGALGVLVRHWRAVARLAAGREWRRLRALLARMSHPFWSHHYTFQGEPAARPLALLGGERAAELLVNVFLPAAGDWETLLRMKAPERNRRSRIAAARLLAQRPDVHALLGNAVNQQGMLQLYEDFCSRDASDCVGCPFPEMVRPGRVP